MSGQLQVLPHLEIVKNVYYMLCILWSECVSNCLVLLLSFCYARLTYVALCVGMMTNNERKFRWLGYKLVWGQPSVACVVLSRTTCRKVLIECRRLLRCGSFLAYISFIVVIQTFRLHAPAALINEFQEIHLRSIRKL